jgi:hypothetical protein
MTDIFTWFHNADAADLLVFLAVSCFFSFLWGFLDRAWETRKVPWFPSQSKPPQLWHNRSRGELVSTSWMTPSLMKRDYLQCHLVTSLYMRGEMVLIEDLNRRQAWGGRTWGEIGCWMFPNRWIRDIETIVDSRFPSEKRSEK